MRENNPERFNDSAITEEDYLRYVDEDEKRDEEWEWDRDRYYPEWD